MSTFLENEWFFITPSLVEYTNETETEWLTALVFTFADPLLILIGI